MRGLKALAAAVVVSTGVAGAVALAPTPVLAQSPLQQQLEQAIVSLPPDATRQQAQAAIDAVLAASPASAGEK